VTEPHPPPDAGTGPARRPATEAEARALASAVRLRIIRLCHGDELTNKDIARRLGRDPASVLHHVRRLVDTGFLEPLPPRRGTRGAREIPYRSTGKSWTLDVDETAGPARTNRAMLHAFLAELDEAGGELADATRLGLRLRPADREELGRRIGALLEEFRARSGGTDGEWWSVFYALHRDHRGRT
jgi:DNA-binding transcriptional ArsR family regulator